MPLFRSHSSTGAEAAPRRTDLERQIGCIAGFFQIFDHHTHKQIAGPRKEPPYPPSSESYLFADPVVKEDDLNLANLCDDSKVTAGRENDKSLTNTLPDAHACPATQLALASNGCLSHPSQEEKLRRERSSNVREELSQANAMVRHGSFNRKQDYREDDISFSPRRAHIGAYAAGGRRFTSKEMDTEARYSIDTHEDSRRMPKEEEKWGFWSSPASHWPSSSSVSGEQELPQEGAAEGIKNGWLATGGRERAWAAEDSLEDWKQSLRALVRLREDGETGVLSSRGSCAATQTSPRVVRNDPSASPARASAFDFKDAIRWSQRVSSQSEGSRRSLDDRDLPRSIAELRDAIHARSRLLSAASLPPSPRTPSVVARLMGLEDLPKPPITEPTPFTNHRNRKPSGEAKLLQQLLQYSPPTPSSFTHSLLPPSPTSSLMRQAGQGLRTASSADSPTFTSNHRNLLTRSNAQSMSRNLESIAHSGSINASSAKHVNTSLNHAKPHEPTRHTGSTWEGATEHRPLRSAALKKINQQRLPVVVLKQAEDIRSPSCRSNHGFHDEIERRLRQLGLQSSEQERKTLKQILEGMQVKGLLQSPEGTKFSNEAKRQQASFPGNASPVLALSNGIESWPPPMTKSVTGSHLCVSRSAKNDSGASIVIMRPVAKSVSRVVLTGDDRKLGIERTGTPSSRTEKSTLRKPKNAINSEASTAKDSAGHRPKLRSTASKPHNPVPTRKVSLKIRQSQVHVSKGVTQAMPSEQARRSGLDIPTRRQEHAPSRSSVTPVVMNACSNAPENRTSVEASHAHNSNIQVVDRTLDVVNQPNCKLGSSGASSDVEVLEHVQVMSRKESGGRTPPRESKGEHNFGSSEDCCLKEVTHEQCSPVSVLDAHLSEDEESSPAPESIRVLTDFQEDFSRCSSSGGELRFSLQESEDIEAQLIPVEINYIKAAVTDSIDEASARDEDFLEVAEDTLQEAQDQQGQACENTADLLYIKEDVLQDDMGCACDSSCFMEDMVERADECTDGSRACEHMKETYANNETCIHMDATLRSIEDSVYMDDSAGARDIMHMNDACASAGDYVCGSQGVHADEVYANNADFCYTEDVLRAAGLTGTWAGGTCTADGWLACGGKMCREVYEELEDQWDAINPEEEGGHLKSEDRDMGGELYRKSHQASMRRRLVFDCLNEIVEGHLSWLGMPGTCGTRAYGHLPVSMLWGDLQRLEQGPYSAEDSMYAMLEQDLLHDADYSTPFCWSSMPTQLATVALHLESDIFDALVSEILPQAPL